MWLPMVHRLPYGAAAAEEAGLLGASEERIPLLAGGFAFGVGVHESDVLHLYRSQGKVKVGGFW